MSFDLSRVRYDVFSIDTHFSYFTEGGKRVSIYLIDGNLGIRPRENGLLDDMLNGIRYEKYKLVGKGAVLAINGLQVEVTWMIYGGGADQFGINKLVEELSAYDRSQAGNAGPNQSHPGCSDYLE